MLRQAAPAAPTSGGATAAPTQLGSFNASALADFRAVDINVTLYVTRDSFFTRLGQNELIAGTSLGMSMATLGYTVEFRSIAIEVPLSAVPLVVRLPPDLIAQATNFYLTQLKVRPGLFEVTTHPVGR